MNSFCSLLVITLGIITHQVHGDLEDEVLYITPSSGESTIQEVSNSNAICGGDLSSESGIFQSPKYPKKYYPNAECTWNITVPENYQVALKFQSFHLEGRDDCDYDYVVIRDGHESTSPVLGKFCGYVIPKDLVSSSNKMAVKFASDSSGQSGGFAAEFIKDVDECKGDHGCEHMCINAFEGYRCECRIGFELGSDGSTCVESCGGVIEEASGVITSPSFPDLYPPNKNCSWEIIAPLGHEIILNFTNFDLEEYNEGCEYDSVDIRSKMPENMPQFRRHVMYCDSSLPPVITSDSNILRIDFSSDGSEQRSGFSAFFYTDKNECSVNNGGCEHNCENEKEGYQCQCYDGFELHENLHNCTEGVCGGNVSSDEGIFHSPNYPEAYWPNKECTWIITVPEDSKVALKFQSFDLESSSICEYDYVEVLDGDESTSPVLGKFCKEEIPEHVLSTSNKMTVKLVTDGSVQKTGFEAEFNKASDECKEGDHGCEHECINTFGSYRCECRIGFELQSDGRKCVAICGGEMFSEKGTLNSPDYPENYRPTIQCTWNITVPENFHVALKFQSFELERGVDCSSDYLEIRDGLEPSSPVLGKLCGDEIPEDIFSSSNEMGVKFVSDHSVQLAGFAAEFNSDVDECKGEDHGCEHECINTFGSYLCKCRIGFELQPDGRKCLVDCGGLITQAKGIITSPSFPDHYPPNKTCSWEIVVPKLNRIVLNFTDFDLEGNEVCVFDRVDIGNQDPETEIRNQDTFCGSKLPPVIISKSHIVRIDFSSDTSVEKSGFRAHFFTDEDECATNKGGCEDVCENTVGGYTCSCNDDFVLHENLHNCTKVICGGELSSEKGIVYSPNYPDFYPNGMECRWNITVPENRKVMLKFQIFELEYNDDCNYDYLEIRDGHEFNSPVLGKYCGQDIPEDIYSSSNKMSVKFVSDSSGPRNGFAAGFVQDPDECKNCKRDFRSTLGDLMLSVQNHLRDVLRRKQG